MSQGALSYVRNLLGLDVLTIEAGEEEGEGPALGVGRYVADGVPPLRAGGWRPLPASEAGLRTNPTR